MGEFANRSIATPSGRISYAEAGSGLVALFVHGVLLNKHLWRHQLAELSAIRRCIAVDLLAHGNTEIAPGQDVSVTANAKMLRDMLDALHIDQVDLIGNDSGGGIAQIFAALKPDRVRTLTLTNCDTHDNWPPEAFKPFVDMVSGGGLRDTLNVLLANKAVYRSQEALGPAYERPEKVTDEDIETYLRPFVRNDQRTLDLQRFVTSFDNKHTVSIAPKLRLCALRHSSFGPRTTSIFRSSGRTGLPARYPAQSRLSSSRQRACSFRRSGQGTSTGYSGITC